MLLAVRSGVVPDCHACPLLGISSNWQECRIKQFVVKQQKRPVFQQHSDIVDGELIYKHNKRYIYMSMHFLMTATMALVLTNAALFMSGYTVTADDIFDEQTKEVLLYVTMIFCPPLYLLSHNIISRTIFYIYYNQSKRHFHGICYNWHLTRKNIMFKPGEVQMVPENAGVMQLLRGGYIIDKKPYHISSMDFNSPRYYNLMLGFINP